METTDKCNTTERKICSGLGIWMEHQDDVCPNGASFLGFAPLVLVNSGNKRTALVVSIQHHKAWTDLHYCPFCGSDIREGFGAPGDPIQQADQETFDRLVAEYEDMKKKRAEGIKAAKKEQRAREKARKKAMKDQGI